MDFSRTCFFFLSCFKNIEYFCFCIENILIGLRFLLLVLQINDSHRNIGNINLNVDIKFAFYLRFTLSLNFTFALWGCTWACHLGIGREAIIGGNTSKCRAQGCKKESVPNRTRFCDFGKKHVAVFNACCYWLNRKSRMLKDPTAATCYTQSRSWKLITAPLPPAEDVLLWGEWGVSSLSPCMAVGNRWAESRLLPGTWNREIYRNENLLAISVEENRWLLPCSRRSFLALSSRALFFFLRLVIGCFDTMHLWKELQGSFE